MNIQTIEIGQASTIFDVPKEPYVLVVDDEHSILSVVMLLLETEEYQSFGFSDSTKVLPFLEQLQSSGQQLPSVILLDLMMPEVSGYQIAAAVSNQVWAQDISVIIMTADHRIHGAQNVPGATDWLSKPFRIEVLLNKLEKYFPQTRAE